MVKKAADKSGKSSTKKTGKPHYWLQAPLSGALGKEVLSVIDKIRNGSFRSSDNEQVVDVVARMTDEVVRYAFMRPVEAIGLGFAARGAVEVAIRSSIQSTRYVLKVVVPLLNERQREQFATILESALHTN